MSGENARLFRQALAAFNRRDKAAFVALCDPAYENLPPRDWPESAAMRGPEAIWNFFLSNQEPWEEGSFEIGELIDAGNGKVVGEMHAEMRGKTSGADVSWSHWHVITFREGKAIRSEWFTDRADALEAAGIQE